MKYLVGKILSNKYEVLEKIGVGGMAVVFKGRDIRLKREVAIKVLKDEYAQDKEFIERFRSESMAIAKVSHPNIVNVFDVGFDDDVNYIVMELVQGQTLKNYIDHIHAFMKEEAIINIGIQVSSALSQAHRKHVVHRDIKAHNILIDEDGRVKVADFGIARAATDQTAVVSKEAFGSVHYASPEQARGEIVDERTDIYSLGILLFELATKTLPFEADTPVGVALLQIKEPLPDPRQYQPTLSDGFCLMLEKATQKKASDRYQNIGELIGDLKSIKENPNFLPKPMLHEKSTTVLPTKEIRQKIKEEAPDIKKMTPLNMMLVILSALGLALLVSVGILFLRSGTTDNDSVTMIEVIGKSKEEVIRELADIGLQSDASHEEINDMYEQGIVVQSDVEEGQQLKKGYIVKLTISKGSKKQLLPSFEEKSLNEAKATLYQLSIPYEIESIRSELPIGTVIKQTPKVGTNIEEVVRVYLTVSMGDEQEDVLVPSLKKSTVRSAESTLHRLDLNLGKVSEEYNATIEKGKIISNTSVGSVVAPGTFIDVIVSLGPMETTTEEETTTESVSTETVVVNIDTATFEKESEKIRIDFINNGVKTIVYEATISKQQGGVIPVVLTLAGSGEGTILVYQSSFLKFEQGVVFH